MLPDQALAFLGAVFVLFGVMGCIMLAIILRCVMNVERAVSNKRATSSLQPTSSPGLFPQKKWMGPTHFFKGKALGTRLGAL